MAHPTVTWMNCVGASRLGIRPMRLQNRMNTVSVMTTGNKGLAVRAHLFAR